MAKWPYSTARWQRLRRLKLADSPLCEPCERMGRVVTARHVDHVQAIAKGGDPFPALAGLMSMCLPCHNVKTAALDRAGGSGLAFPGAGVDGLPIDPAHPWSAEGYTPSPFRARQPWDRRGPRIFTKFGGGDGT